MTRSTRTPADVPDHVGEAQQALKAITRAVANFDVYGSHPPESAPGHDHEGALGSDRTPTRTGSPLLGDARHPQEQPDPDGPDPAKTDRAKWQRCMRHLADAVLALTEGTDVEDGSAAALIGAAVIADVGSPNRPDAPKRRDPHLLPTVDTRDAMRMVGGLQRMLPHLERGDLPPPEGHAVIHGCDEVIAAKRALPAWSRRRPPKRKRQPRQPRCGCGRPCEWRADRGKYRDTCQGCRKERAA